MFVIRRLRVSDAEQVASLTYQLAENIVNAEELVERIENLVDQISSEWIVAELDGFIVGSAGLVWNSIASMPMVATIEELVVDQENRYQGIEDAMLETLIKLAKKVGVVQIRLFSEPISTDMYKKSGFVKEDKECLVMKLS